MPTIHDEIERTLRPGMYIPEPLALLFKWIEDNGFIDYWECQRVGFLFTEDKIEAEKTEFERPGGTRVIFHAHEFDTLDTWFGHQRPEVLNRLCVFARVGGEGSMAAFWIDDQGKQRIVHLGSGSGSTTVCVLADDPIDFLRLLAIGYDEICWHEHYSEPPNSREDEQYVHPNVAYQNWVKQTFSVTIPKTALEIVKHPAEMGDVDSLDDFCRWVESNVE